VAVPHVVTVRHVAHYRADLTSPKRHARLTGGGGIRGRIFPYIWETGPKPGISLEGAKAGPRPGFDSCPRATELGTTQGAPVHGQGLKPRSRGTSGRIRG
jgi:hypothetical protein